MMTNAPVLYIGDEHSGGMNVVWTTHYHHSYQSESSHDWHPHAFTSHDE